MKQIIISLCYGHYRSSLIDLTSYFIACCKSKKHQQRYYTSQKKKESTGRICLLLNRYFLDTLSFFPVCLNNSLFFFQYNANCDSGILFCDLSSFMQSKLNFNNSFSLFSLSNISLYVTLLAIPLFKSKGKKYG